MMRQRRRGGAVGGGAVGGEARGRTTTKGRYRSDSGVQDVVATVVGWGEDGSSLGGGKGEGYCAADGAVGGGCGGGGDVLQCSVRGEDGRWRRCDGD